MKEYKVTAKYTEFLPDKIIKARSPEEAQEIYTEMWDNGEIPCFNSKFDTRVK